MINAQILSTGDEVLLGDILDTNSHFLCDRLKQENIQVTRITAVGDDVDDIADTLDQISHKADLCLVTGGLGPTQDDLTSLACSRASGGPLVLNEDALASMESYFEKRGFVLTKDNRKQAMMPETAGILINDHGTAPGFFLHLNRCLFLFLPGVPVEMVRMFESRALPVIQDRFGLDHRIFIERLTVFGLPESRVGANLKGFHGLFPGIRLGFRASFPSIEVKMVMADSKKNLLDRADENLLARAKRWVVDRLENKVVSLEGRSLAAEVGHLLRQQGQTLAIAESCTGGLISNWVTDVAGSSDYFLFSGTTYSNFAKEAVLSVSPKTLSDHGAVHEQTALEMAHGARNAVGADWGISTTGIAGPGGGTREKPVGTVCIGVAGPGQSQARRFRFSFDDRAKNKKMFAATALEMLRRHLAGLSPLSGSVGSVQLKMS